MQKSPLLRSLKIAAVATAIFLGAAGVSAATYGTWADPTAAPPGSNAAAPLSLIGDQTKQGGLLVNDVKPDGSTAATGLDVLNGLSVFGGNVGIGTTSPRGMLDVWGGSILATGADKSGTALMTSSGGTAYFSNNSVGNGISIDPSGNVGIGTASPGAKLVISNTANQPALSIGDSGADNGATYGMLNLNRPADTTRAHLAFIRAGYYVWQMGYVPNTNTLGIFPWNLNSGGTPSLALTTGGNIGIGTASPGAKLEVAGSVKSTTGGFIFPDGTSQSTAVSKPVYYEVVGSASVPGGYNNFAACHTGDQVTGGGFDNTSAPASYGANILVKPFIGNKTAQLPDGYQCYGYGVICYAICVH